MFRRWLGLAVLVLVALACGWLDELNYDSGGEGAYEGIPTVTEAAVIPEPLSPPPVSAFDTMSLWTDGTRLRGANTWQRIVVPRYDGPDFLGSGYIGPPYTQEDFNRLSALGANYVNLSHPGIFTERPPYGLDEQAQANLDQMIAMAAQADLFVVITFRTGPGRNDFTFYRDDDWFAVHDLIEAVWSDESAQQAWVEMWRYTAGRYKDQPVVVGYDLMCEPNANEILDEWDQEAFFAAYTGTVYDWNRWYPEIVAAIREVDDQTPILVGGEGYSALDWMPSLRVIDDERIVYTFHQYAPFVYSHQEPGGPNTYPGRFDADYDGQADTVDRFWIKEFLSTARMFSEQHGVPVAVNEFGVGRWQPGAAEFMHDEMAAFEDLGLNYALWVWDPDWRPWNEGVNSLNFRYGPDPDNTTGTPNQLQDVITGYWARNQVRPSTIDWQSSTSPRFERHDRDPDSTLPAWQGGLAVISGAVDLVPQNIIWNYQPSRSDGPGLFAASRGEGDVFELAP
ncbi:MAG: cellulase family glycosylhydrolase [Anaerolineales bacterium]|nr:cellulase family glycosylhydrolase [Anaerolineales bacterium]